MSVKYDFTGQRFLVTGPSPSSTIGQAIAQRLAESGAGVILVARGEKGLNDTLAAMPHPERHVVAPYDLSNMDGIPPWMKELATKHGPISGVVHSASVQGYSPVRIITQASFNETFHVNVGAGLMLARGLRQKDVAAKPASIVFIASAAGLKGIKGRALYAGSKATEVAMTKTLGLEMAGEDIRVNCIAPGVVQGHMADMMFDAIPPEQVAALRAGHPLGFPEGRDVAAAAAFLLSDEARMITGIALPVDGGYAAG